MATEPQKTKPQDPLEMHPIALAVGQGRPVKVYGPTGEVIGDLDELVLADGQRIPVRNLDWRSSIYLSTMPVGGTDVRGGGPAVRS